jgi:DNA recombination protein RmuC
MSGTELLLAGILLALVTLTLALLLRGRGGAAPVLERALRDELRAGREEQLAALTQLSALQQRQLEALGARLAALTASLQEAGERQARLLTAELERLREGNERKLEEMRVTVDERLYGTLERRLGESFALVSERLEAVQRGLGEMQALAAGVGDLKRVLTNVKTRGVWGEYQLGAILEQVLTPDQYCANHRPRAERPEMVEYAVRLPGREPEGDPVYLPIDAKFPQEDYQRLLDAAERADPEALASSTAALVRAVRLSAREIGEKYLAPPATTDFAIMFLPTEGLYAEVLRQPGLVQELHAECRVVVAGPTTLAAILSSLRMGFRTIAIERRSSEVWRVLGAVKSEFGRFGEVLDRVRKQLVTASNTIEDTGRRTRAMEQRLRHVEELSPDLAVTVLGLEEPSPEPDAA